MPYADREDFRRYQRELHNERYWTDPEFREYEARRKAEWYQANKEKAAERLRLWRAKRRAEGKPIAAPHVTGPKRTKKGLIPVLRLEKASA